MKPNIICSQYHDGRAFSWEGKHGTIEISTLGFRPFCSVYNDSLDNGFGVQGKKRQIIFRVENILRDREDDITSWEMISISEPGFSLTVLND